MRLNLIKRSFCTSNGVNERNSNPQEIRIKYTEKDQFFPIREIPQFQNGYFTVFEYVQEPVQKDENGLFQRLPQVPYEIKEHALKGVLYTFFLTFLGRFSAAMKLAPIKIFNIKFFPHYVASVAAYHTLRPLWYMYNSVTKIQLSEDGMKIRLEFKNGLKKPVEIEISRIYKKKAENFMNECYTEPFLFPVEIDYTDIKGEYSLLAKRTVYLYGDSHKCIKHGEILRALLNGQSIKLA